MIVDAMQNSDWPLAAYRAFKKAGVRQIGYVPDAGLASLIRRIHDDTAMAAVSLTTEEEGVGLLAGAWLGGERCALLMQSSGVGNLVNTFSMIETCRFPFFALVTMRGEWSEFNPWQCPMGARVEATFSLLGVQTFRVDHEAEVGEFISGALDQTFNTMQPTAVLVSQKMLGRKEW